MQVIGESIRFPCHMAQHRDRATFRLTDFTYMTILQLGDSPR